MPLADASQLFPRSTLSSHPRADMDMDMDIGWCLACSKRTRDQRSPYCSDACRQHDTTHPNTAQADTAAITSPLPPKFLALPPTSSNVSRQTSERRASRVGVNTSPHRPETQPVQGRLPMVSDPTELEHCPRQRDRRAFSFPASEGSSTLPHERSTLPFVRKTTQVNNTSRSFRTKHMSHDASRAGSGQATGINTPLNGNDSPFDSTSDSDDKEELIRRSPAMSLSALHPPPPVPHLHASSSSVAAVAAAAATIPPPVSQATSLMSSPLHTARPSLEARAATSPITRMGSSSRSREDIISWARNVDSGVNLSSEGSSDTGGDSSQHNTARGRPRRPRPNALSDLTPPSTESLDDPVERTGSTPTSASRALSALSFTPVVNALRRVSIGGVPPSPESTSALGLQPMPAPAEVSIVDVVVGTRAQEVDHFFVEGDTPTLSTVSMSEAQDPSNTDFGETIDTVTDDFSVVSSSNDRRGSYGQRYAQISSCKVQSAMPPQQRKSSLPLRPIQTTASAFWNLSSYLRSLAPFGMAGSVAPMTPHHERVMTPTIPEASAVTHTTPDFKSVPVPTHNMYDAVDPLVDPAQDMVRSVPMDIVITSRVQALAEERQREREAEQLLKVGRTPPKRVEASRSPSPGKEAKDLPEPPAVEDDRRGRGRRREASPAPAIESSDSDDGRGRRRDRTRESRERSWSAHRGRTSRSRTTRAAVAV